MYLSRGKCRMVSERNNIIGTEKSIWQHKGTGMAGQGRQGEGVAEQGDRNGQKAVQCDKRHKGLR